MSHTVHPNFSFLVLTLTVFLSTSTAMRLTIVETTRMSLTVSSWDVVLNDNQLYTVCLCVCLSVHQFVCLFPCIITKLKPFRWPHSTQMARMRGDVSLWQWTLSHGQKTLRQQNSLQRRIGREKLLSVDINM